MWLSALFLIALTSSTALANKPTVAILGLEVVDPSGIDATSTSVARDLTEGLRARAKAGTGPYQLAIGSDKELIDEKLIHNCDELIGCMSEIGKNLGAKYLITGKVSGNDERSEDMRRVQYFLFLQVIDVETSAIKWQRKTYVTKAIK